MLRACALGLLAVLFASPATIAQQPATTSERVFLIKAGRLLDVRSGTYLADRGILVRGDRIAEVGALAAMRSRAPKEAEVIDLSGATVLPGLIDCHSHLLAAMKPSWGSEAVVHMLGLGPSARALLGAGMARELLEEGFTTVRNLGHSGLDGDAALRDAVNNGWTSGPRIQSAARKITPPGGQAISARNSTAEAVIEQEFLAVSGADSARKAVRTNLYYGVDVIKIVMDAGKRLLTLEETRVIVEEAHRSGMKVAAHATTPEGVRTAVEAGVDSVEHADALTPELAADMRKKAIFLSPTLWSAETARLLFVAPYNLNSEELAGFEGWAKSNQETAAKKLRLARAAEVKIVFGSDMWFEFPGKTRGQATMLRLADMQRAGLSAIETLRSATINAAELLGWSDRVGSIEPNKFADLIAVEGDPLANISALQQMRFVMKGGTVIRNEFSRPASSSEPR